MASKDLRARKLADEELSGGVIFQIYWDIREGNADPEQAKRLLRQFLECTETGRPEQKVLPEPLIEYFRHAFAEYLKNPKRGQLERLLGLVAPRKRPRTQERKHHDIAWTVLERRLQGETLENAASYVSKRFNIAENKVQDIWAKHKMFALTLEAVSRGRKDPEGRARWTPTEASRLEKIYTGYIRRDTP